MPATKDTHGQLRSSVSGRAGGRKIDTLSFVMDSPGQSGKRDKIEFDVYLLGDRSFVVQTEDIDKSRWTHLKGKVLDDLALAAEQAARKEFDLRHQLTWSNWLEVRIVQVDAREQQRRGGVGAQAQVSYAPITRGELPDGRAFTTGQRPGDLLPFPTNAQVDEGDEWGGRRKEVLDEEALAQLSPAEQLHRRLSNIDRRAANEQFTYLPDTPEARAGLDAIISAIDLVNQRLQAFLHPNEIARTLTRAAQSGPALLTGPVEPVPTKTKGPR